MDKNKFGFKSPPLNNKLKAWERFGCHKLSDAHNSTFSVIWKIVQINIADLRTGDSPENKMVEVQRLQLSEHSIRRKTGKLKSIEDLQHLEWQHKHSVSKIFTDAPNKRNTRCTRCKRFVSYSSHILQVPWYNSFQDPCLMKFKWPLFDKETSASQILSQWVFPVKLLPSDLEQARRLIMKSRPSKITRAMCVYTGCHLWHRKLAPN